MTTTLPNGVKTPTTADSIDPVVLLGAVANGFSDSIGGLGTGKRQPRYFQVADQTEKAALSGLTTLADGDMVHVSDTGLIEMWDGTAVAWKWLRTTKALTYNLSTTNFTIGNGVTSFHYSLDGEWVHLWGSLTFGSTSDLAQSAGWDLILPFPMADTGNFTVGTCAAQRGMTATNILGGVIIATGSAKAVNTYWYTTAAALQNIGWVDTTSSMSPLVSGDIISFDIRYRRVL